MRVTGEVLFGREILLRDLFVRGWPCHNFASMSVSLWVASHISGSTALALLRSRRRRSQEEPRDWGVAVSLITGRKKKKKALRSKHQSHRRLYSGPGTCATKMHCTVSPLCRLAPLCSGLQDTRVFWHQLKPFCKVGTPLPEDESNVSDALVKQLELCHVTYSHLLLWSMHSWQLLFLTATSEHFLFISGMNRGRRSIWTASKMWQ